MKIEIKNPLKLLLELSYIAGTLSQHSQENVVDCDEVTELSSQLSKKINNRGLA